jgi:hypothetical protein
MLAREMLYHLLGSHSTSSFWCWLFSSFSKHFYFYYIIIVLGYIVAFTKFLTIYQLKSLPPSFSSIPPPPSFE